MAADKPHNKIVLFPGSADRLVNEGLQELKEGDKEKSLQLFQEALAHSEDNEGASYGLLLAYAETGRLHEGKKWAEGLMNKAVGDYFEVLQVYVSILAQLGEYDEVVHILETVQAEESFPVHIHQQMQELLQVSRSMSDTVADNSGYTEQPAEINAVTSNEWEEKLSSKNPQVKMAVLQELRDAGPSHVLPVIRRQLSSPDVSPLMKSFLLFLLKDWETDENVWIEKLNRKGEFSPVSLPSIEESTFYIEAFALLTETLEQNNPPLWETATHLLRQLLLFYYPFPPAMEMEDLAAVLHHEAALHLGQDADESIIIEQYEVSKQSFEKTSREFNDMQKYFEEL
ncbi:tetratricopeptide repeat protein [Alteribacillus sp. HJP-4]|uniref:tetratricopeptide repeat protein n=1 Tax=Alteribacillus sp. HJP-4 TaxID=2775394 RepID=UPI0035CCEE47